MGYRTLTGGRRGASWRRGRPPLVAQKHCHSTLKQRPATGQWSACISPDAALDPIRDEMNEMRLELRRLTTGND